VILLSAHSAPPTLTIVIPVLNEETALASLLPSLHRAGGVLEVLVVDGGSDDGSETLVRDHGFRWLRASKRGRGGQLALGADEARGEVLFFLHADSRPPENFPALIAKRIQQPDCVGGAFRFGLTERRWYEVPLTVGVNLRSRIFILPYGDQGYFVRKSVYHSVGGFRDLRVFEDVDLLKRLKKAGDFVLLNSTLRTSPRRWDREGFFSRTVRNWMAWARYAMGARDDRLADFYEKAERSAP
jgi:rSAM/selenodomain-associated transferase 2